MKYLDENGLLYLVQKIKTWLNGKVDKVNGKGLSTNDYTTAEKNKLAGLSNYSLPTASSSTLGGVKVGSGLAINNGVLSATGGGTADSVDWSNVQNKPTKVSEFTNDSNFQTATQVNATVQAVVGSAPDALNTLKELADALGNDKNFASTVTTELSKKANASDLTAKQDKLVSGTNIKTVNGTSLLGSGNIAFLPELDKTNWFNNEIGFYRTNSVNGGVAIVMVTDARDGGKSFTYFDPAVAGGTVMAYTQASSTSDLKSEGYFNICEVLTTHNMNYEFTKEEAIDAMWEDEIATIYAVYKYIEDNTTAITNAEIDTIVGA
jgi:hypothetical protein